MTSEKKIAGLLRLQDEGIDRSEIATVLGYSGKRPEKSLHKFMTNNGYIRENEIYITDDNSQTA